MTKKKDKLEAICAIVIARETHEAITKLAKQLKITDEDALDRILCVGIEAVRIGYFGAKKP